MSLHYNCDKSHIHVHKIESCKLKGLNNKPHCQLYLGIVSKDFKEITLKWKKLHQMVMFMFLIDYIEQLTQKIYVKFITAS